MWFTRLAISRPILIWMALAAIAILGVQSYFRLPAELNPRVAIPTLTVTTIYPGAGPPEVEMQISKPMEEAVGSVGGINDLFSSSQPGVSILSMDFAVGTDLDAAISEVRSRVDVLRAQLPAESRPPIVAKLDINALPILYLGLISPSQSQQQLRTLADKTIRTRLERVAGVASVQILGGEEREARVSVDPNRLIPLGLTLEDVVNSIKAGGRDVPAGGVAQGQRETDVRLAGAYDTLGAIRSAPILSPSLMQGSGGQANSSFILHPSSLPPPPVTVADVADVTFGPSEQTAINRINGREGVSLVFTKAPDANTVKVVDGINAALAELAPALPHDLERVVLRDDSVTVREALSDVNLSLALGAVLAMTVILLFLHNLRGTLIVSLAIPACMVATFLVMQVVGFTLNQMTLLALSLSVGILVDDSIVVLESITRHLRQGESPAEAAYNGRAEIGFADITTTLVDVVVFVPIAFMGGIVGSFFKQFGLTIATATLFSLVISFSVTPMLAARWYRQGENLEANTGIFAPIERFYRTLERVYRRILRVALRRRWLVIASGVALLALVFWVSFQRLGFEFLPGTDQGQLTVNVEMPPGASLDATDAVMRRVETLVRQEPDIRATLTNVGRSLGGFGTIPQQGPQFAQLNVRLYERGSQSSAGERTRQQSDETIAARLRDRLNPIAREVGGRITVTALRSVEGLQVPIQLKIQGDDLDALTRFASQVRDRMGTIHGVLDPDVSVRGGKPEIRASIIPTQTARFGIAASASGALLRDAISGNTDAVLRRGGDEFTVRVQQAKEEDKKESIPNFQARSSFIPHPSSLASVRGVIVGYNSARQPITLADIADVQERTGPTSVERYNGRRVVTISANLASDAPLGNVQQVIERELKTMPHPGMDVDWGGDAKVLSENAYYFASALILAVILVYIVMASLFNNLGTPFVIMFTLPMALVGALGALVLTGESMSLIAAIGILMLVGLMGRNAILLLDFTNTLRGRGLARNDALEEAGATRLRPILMTTIATMIGMSPVALRFGRASEMRAPMAIVVIGGLAVSTILTLVVIPALYSLFDDWFGKRKMAQPGAATSELAAAPVSFGGNGQHDHDPGRDELHSANGAGRETSALPGSVEEAERTSNPAFLPRS